MGVKPSAVKIRDLKTSLEKAWGGQIQDDKNATELVEQTYEVDTPNPQITDWKPVKYHSGTAPEAIQRYNGLLGQRPACTVDPGWGAGAEERADDAEKFLNLLPWLIEREFGLFWEPNGDDQRRLGRGWIEVLPHPDRWSADRGYPVKGEGEGVRKNEGDKAYNERNKKWRKQVALPPISIRHLPADDVYVVISPEFGIIEYVQKMTLTVSEVLNRWGDELPKLKAKKDRDSTEEIEVVKYGNDEWIAYWIDSGEEGEIAKTFEHGMRVVPLAYTPGLTRPKRKNGKLWRSILADSGDSIKMRDELRTRQATAIKMFPLPQLVITTDMPSGKESDKPTITMDPRKPIVLWKNETAAFAQPTGQLAEAESLDTKVTEQLERNLIPDVNRGMSGSSETPAWSVRQQLEQTDTVLMPFMEKLALGAERMWVLVCRAIMSPWIGETVYVRIKGRKGMTSIGMGPDEAAEAMNNIHATITRKQTIDRNQDLVAMKAAYELGFPWVWCVQTYIGVENAQELKDRRMLEDIENAPPLVDQTVENVLRKAGLLRAQRAAMPPDQMMARMGNISPEWQQTIGQAVGTDRTASAPTQQMVKTGATTREIPGAKPVSAVPGGATP